MLARRITRGIFELGATLLISNFILDNLRLNDANWRRAQILAKASNALAVLELTRPVCRGEHAEDIAAWQTHELGVLDHLDECSYAERVAARGILLYHNPRVTPLPGNSYDLRMLVKKWESS